jgi:branched-chain amino acid transport system substrate-binding protein
MKYLIGAIALAATLAATACSSATSGTSGSGGSTNSATSPATSASSASSASSATTTVGRFTFPSGSATGSPVNVGLINSNNQIPELANAAQAAVDYANAHLGGIAGHKINLVVCDEKANPTAASACTPMFVQNKVIAVLGFPLVWVAVGGLKGLAAVNIPYLGFGQADADTAANSYPIYSGDLALGGMLAAFKTEHVKTVNILSVNYPASVAVVNNVFKPIWTAAGITIGKTVFYTSGAADMSTPSLQAVSGNPQGIYLIQGPQDVARSVGAIKSDGYTGKIFSGYSSLTPALYPAAAKVMSGVTVSVGQMAYFNDTTDPEVALMHTILGSVPVDSFSQTGVSQVLTLVSIGDKIGANLTGASVLDYLKGVHGQDVFMSCQMNISQVPPVPQLAHVTNGFDRFMTYENGGFKYTTGWISPWRTVTPGECAS